MAANIQNSFEIPLSNNTQTIATSVTSAQSANIDADTCVVYSTNFCFAVQGVNPTATTAGMPLAAGVHYRIPMVQKGLRLAFILASSTGSVYVTPGV